MDASWVCVDLPWFCWILHNRQTIQKMKPKWPGQEREPQMTAVFRGGWDVAGVLLGDVCLKLSSQNGTNINQYFWLKQLFGRLGQGGKDMEGC